MRKAPILLVCGWGNEGRVADFSGLLYTRCPGSDGRAKYDIGLVKIVGVLLATDEIQAHNSVANRLTSM